MKKFVALVAVAAVAAVAIVAVSRAGGSDEDILDELLDDDE